MVQMVYNLLYYQVVTQVSFGLTNAERMRAANLNNEGESIKNLSDALGLINSCLGDTEFYMEDDSSGESSTKPQVNIVALEQQVSFN